MQSLQVGMVTSFYFLVFSLSLVESYPVIIMRRFKIFGINGGNSWRYEFFLKWCWLHEFSNIWCSDSTWYGRDYLLNIVCYPPLSIFFGVVSFSSIISSRSQKYHKIQFFENLSVIGENLTRTSNRLDSSFPMMEPISLPFWLQILQRDRPPSLSVFPRILSER